MNRAENLTILGGDRFWLTNATIPVCLLEMPPDDPIYRTIRDSQTFEGLSLVALEIDRGAIASILPATTSPARDIPQFDLDGGQLWPCFVDLHAHLDKGHIWMRSPNPDGSFDAALKTVIEDAQQHWNAEDVSRRLEFALKCSYAHGTKAIRTHIDSFGEQAAISLGVFQELQTQWKNRLILQAVTLVSLDYYLTPEGEKLADLIAKVGGILGGVAYMNPDLDKQIDRVFVLAKERQLNLDFHTDENGDVDSVTLRQIAKAALKHQFPGKITCGHCCSLAVQPPELVTETLALVKEAGIGIVSLPTCNLYLQDRSFQRTPRWRGVTVLQELKKAGIAVAIASDNCRDPFYGFGDHDVLEVFNMAVKIAHLDMPYRDWPQVVTQTPAELMGLSNVGKIGVGLPADLILFKGRNFSELLSRPQWERIVLRNGKPIDTSLPDYRELDDLLGL